MKQEAWKKKQLVLDTEIKSLEKRVELLTIERPIKVKTIHVFSDDWRTYECSTISEDGKHGGTPFVICDRWDPEELSASFARPHHTRLR